MSLIACKYIEGKGFVGVKNRDRKYKPTILLRKSFRKDFERLLIWDQLTKWSEGVNEAGIAIVSCDTEREDEYSAAKTSDRRYYSPVGFSLRKALFETSVSEAILSLIRQQVPGNILVFSATECMVLEASFDEVGYQYKIREVKKGEIVVRTNHGILMPDNGYPISSDERKSSEKRFSVVEKGLAKVKSVDDLLDVVSQGGTTQDSPLRKGTARGQFRTTGQILIVPSERTIHYRAIWGTTTFDLEKLNSEKDKTFFEIISTRKLLSFREHRAKTGDKLNEVV